MSRLYRLGFSRVETQFRSLYPRLVPARVAGAQHGDFAVMTETTDAWAKLSGSLRDDQMTPVVGDWVGVDAGGQFVIHGVLPRRTSLERKMPGRSSAAQTMVAHVDFVLVVTGGPADFSARRIERYLTLAWEGGAEPYLVFNKMDLHGREEPPFAREGPAFSGVPRFFTDGLTGEGVEELLSMLPPTHTFVLIGSSGAGKSTILNRIAGSQIAATRAVRAFDQAGRHTTTHRSLWLIRDRVFIDTPGLREVGLPGGQEGLARVFGDVQELAAQCRFRDCTHRSEPDCAVRDAAEADEALRTRIEHYLELETEGRRAEARSGAYARREGRRMGKIIREAKAWRRQRRGDRSLE